MILGTAEHEIGYAFTQSFCDGSIKHASSWYIRMKFNECRGYPMFILHHHHNTSPPSHTNAIQRSRDGPFSPSKLSMPHTNTTSQTHTT